MACSACLVCLCRPRNTCESCFPTAKMAFVAMPTTTADSAASVKGSGESMSPSNTLWGRSVCNHLRQKTLHARAACTFPHLRDLHARWCLTECHAVTGARQLALIAVQPQTKKVRVGDIVLMAGLVWQNDAGAADRSNCKRLSRASRWAGPTDAARVGRLLLDVAKV